LEIHDPNAHLKLIEMCECYLETDYSTTIQKVADAHSDDLTEDAFKYLALAILYSLTEKASRLTMKKKKDKISVIIKADYEKIALRSPPPALFAQIIAIMRSILHLEEDKGSMPLVLGLKSGQVDVHVKMDKQTGKETLKIRFPDL
jgi:hypothetical protein